MLNVENIQVLGGEAAIRGMRNPYNSWSKSDTTKEGQSLKVGEADLTLMRKLFRAGSEHRKYCRMIQIYMDITAPLYWWKEFDTYKVGTVANSCSTMHTIHKKEFTLEDFSCEHLFGDYETLMTDLIDVLNIARNRYLATKEKDYWWQMIQLLPTSYNQKRTVMMNIEVAYRIIGQRSGHRLDEWHQLVKILMNLPIMRSLIE